MTVDAASPDTTAEIEEPSGPETWRGRLPALLADSWIFLFLIALVIFFGVVSSAFFQASNLRNIALDTSEVVLLGLGETFVIVTAGIDLSVGGILVFSGVAGGLTMLHFSGTAQQTANLQYPTASTGIPLGIIVTLAAGTAWGLANGILITRLRLPSFIVTLGTLGMSFGGADLLTGGTTTSEPWACSWPTSGSMESAPALRSTTARERLSSPPPTL